MIINCYYLISCYIYYIYENSFFYNYIYLWNLIHNYFFLINNQIINQTISWYIEKSVLFIFNILINF